MKSRLLDTRLAAPASCTLARLAALPASMAVSMAWLGERMSWMPIGLARLTFRLNALGLTSPSRSTGWAGKAWACAGVLPLVVSLGAFDAVPA